MRRRSSITIALVMGLLLSTFSSPALAQQPSQSRRPGQSSPAFPISDYGPRDSDNAVLRFNDAMLATIEKVGGAPPVHARGLAMLNTAIYDAWAAYNATAKSTQPNASGLGEQPFNAAAQDEAINYAAYQVLTKLAPYSGNTSFTAAAMRFPTSSGAPTVAERIGRGAADAVLAARRNDGSGGSASYTIRGSYANDTAALLWQPVVPGTQPALPHWRNVTPFGLPSDWKSNRLYAPAGPKSNNGNLYRKQAEEIVGYVANLTDAQKACALYWADGPSSSTPPGHWDLIAQAVSRRDNNTLDEDVKMFFALGNGVMNAGIVSWESKYRYDFARPFSLIRYMYYYGAKPGKQLESFQNWNSYIATPNFPEYVSGHSTFSGAAAEVLRKATGSDAMNMETVVRAGSGTQFLSPGMTPTSRDVTLGWSTFSEAVSGEEGSGRSRLFGGIHFTDGNEHGVTIGTNAGRAAWDEVNRYVNGSKGF